MTQRCDNCAMSRSGENKIPGSYKIGKGCKYSSGLQCHLYPPKPGFASPAIEPDWVCCRWTDPETLAQPLAKLGIYDNGAGKDGGDHDGL